MQDEIFLTDPELKARWKCSKMTLWRLREAGRLPRPFKPCGGEGGRNLTPLSAIRALETAATAEPVAA